MAARTAARRNPAYRAAADFPHPDSVDPAVDPALLAGLGAPGRFTLDDVQLLHTVAATGSLNRAARVLLVSQPALSRRVRRLEKTLGTVLSPLVGTLLDQLSDAVAAFRAALVPDPR